MIESMQKEKKENKSQQNIKFLKIEAKLSYLLNQEENLRMLKTG